ncbi:xaa-Pro aminopeptidase 2 [Polypterus senegalus]|uniref:xaa-Pro aminopeptidase 2 n=1 Tax=Polypterus senegalus TaxID=55291 RepID=UPI001966AFFD|nr:xaa-Pro aminopeptidase 2 [Polypterus senegalus]
MEATNWCRLALLLSSVTLKDFPQYVSAFSVSGYGETELKDVRDESIRNCTVQPPYLPPTVVHTTQRLMALRQQMTIYNISAYIIPSNDAHLSEYIAKRDGRQEMISGFSGSAGTAVVTSNRAMLWTDSRYWVQAKRQMDCNWELYEDSYVNTIIEWLIQEIPAKKAIGFDPFLFSLDTWEAYRTGLSKTDLTLKSIPNNLVDEIWTDRPPPPSKPIERLPDEFIERSWQKRVAEIRNQMQENIHKPTAVLLSALDETAWLFNLRGDDIPYNPFFYSYTLLSKTEIWLFVEPNRVTNEIKIYLNAFCNNSDCVQILDYHSVRSHVETYCKGDVKVWIGTAFTNYGINEVIPQEKLVLSEYSPVLITKSVKDETEQRILKEAHVRDAVAVIQLLVWLEENVPKGTVDEVMAADYVDEMRSQQPFAKGSSFATISASGPNAALAHYSPNENSSRRLSVDEMYLIDSGGQYLDGTTDITRTLHWGTPSEFQKTAYTRVLMGNIDLSKLIFPDGTRGRNIEMLARQALWKVGLNYGHGTGHGIGNYFCVHEWPVGFQGNNIGMRPGMFTSIEPGFYMDGEFGIRIEDIALVVQAKTQFGTTPYLTFKTVSLVPYDRKLIDTSIMMKEQIEWLNDYYQEIRKVVAPKLKAQQLTKEYNWLQKNTEPFESGSLVTRASVLSVAAAFISNAIVLQSIC